MTLNFPYNTIATCRCLFPVSIRNRESTAILVTVYASENKDIRLFHLPQFICHVFRYHIYNHKSSESRNATYPSKLFLIKYSMPALWAAETPLFS